MNRINLFQVRLCRGMLAGLVLCLTGLLLSTPHAPNMAQENGETDQADQADQADTIADVQPVYVFVQTDAADRNRNELLFINALTGEQRSTSINGSRFTILGRSILYFDPASRRLNVATPDGQIAPHPFMQMSADALRIDWVVSSDGKQIAWTIVSRDDQGGLRTQLYVSHADGSDQRMLREESRKDALRMLPVAFDPTQTRLYLDYQPDGIEGLTAYTQYAGLFILALDEEAPQPLFLPGEPGSFTGAGFGGEYFLRLALSPGQQGFDLRVYNLAAETSGIVRALDLRGAFSQAGDVLIAPDSRQAIYALSQIEAFGTPQQSTRTMLVHFDLAGMTQRILTEVTSIAHPLAWTEDNTAVIFTSPQQPGTWKVSISDGQTVKIAEQTYLGMLQTGSQG